MFVTLPQADTEIKASETSQNMSDVIVSQALRDWRCDQWDKQKGEKSERCKLLIH